MAKFSLESVVYDIETHPVVTAIGIFIVLFLGYNVFNKKSTSPIIPDAATPNGATGNPATSETYYQQYNSYPTVPAQTNPPATQPWQTILAGMKVWRGTSSLNYFYGPNGPQPGRADQTLLSTAFPPGTTFSSSGNGAGSTWYYTLPGGVKTAGGTLVDPNATTCKPGFRYDPKLKKCVKI